MGPWLCWTTCTGKEVHMAAGVFSNHSHTYPWNYQICCWRALVKVLVRAGMKRLQMSAIFSKAATEHGIPRGGQSMGDLSPQKALPATSLITSSSQASLQNLKQHSLHSRISPQDSQGQVPDHYIGMKQFRGPQYEEKNLPSVSFLK